MTRCGVTWERGLLRPGGAGTSLSKSEGKICLLIWRRWKMRGVNEELRW